MIGLTSLLLDITDFVLFFAADVLLFKLKRAHNRWIISLFTGRLSLYP